MLDKTWKCPSLANWLSRSDSRSISYQDQAILRNNFVKLKVRILSWIFHLQYNNVRSPNLLKGDWSKDQCGFSFYLSIRKRRCRCRLWHLHEVWFESQIHVVPPQRCDHILNKLFIITSHFCVVACFNFIEFNWVKIEVAIRYENGFRYATTFTGLWPSRSTTARVWLLRRRWDKTLKDGIRFKVTYA